MTRLPILQPVNEKNPEPVPGAGDAGRVRHRVRRRGRQSARSRHVYHLP